MLSTPTRVATVCYHCGLPTLLGSVQQDDKAFCCEGCRTVYSLLAASGLCGYYTYDSAPGTTAARSANTLPELAFLDDPALARTLLDYADAELNVVTFRVPGMHCTSCLWLLEQLYRLHPGVLTSEVNFTNRTLVVRFRPQLLSLRGLVELLHQLGYPPLLEAKGDTEGQSTKVSEAQRRLVRQIGIAGFALGNIMLLALPDYFQPGAVQHDLQLLFSYLGLALSALSLYAAQDYFRSAWRALRMRHFAIEQPLALGMLAITLRSLWEIVGGTGTGYLDSLAGLIFFLLVGKWLQQRTFDRLQFDRNFRSYFPLGVTELSATGERTIPLQSVVAGQRLVLRAGELVPTDSFLLSPAASFDYSFLTGESALVERQAGELLYSGARLVGGRIEVLAHATASTSRLARLWERPQEGSKISGYTASVNQMAKAFTIAVLVAALLTLAYWLPKDTSTAWLAATGLLIIACPCSLAFAAPFALGTLQAWLGRRGFFLRSSSVVESLAKATDIVFDKTGTLTDPEAARAEFIPAHGELTLAEAAALHTLASQSTHPYSRAIAADVHVLLEPEQFAETTGEGLAATFEGIEYRLGQRQFVAPCRCENKCKAIKALEQAPPETRVHLSIAGKYRGYYKLSASFVPGVGALLTGLAGDGYTLHLLSGDAAGDKERLQPYFPAANLHFEQSPEAKLAYIEQLQAAGKSVLYLGDGLNDVAALTQADAGVAVTGSTALFTPASKGILVRTELAELPRYLQLAKRATQAVKITFGVSLVYNLVGAAFAVQGLLSPVIAAVLMPIISIGSMALATGLTRLAIRRAMPKSPSQPCPVSLKAQLA